MTELLYLCICGKNATKKCSNCKNAHYCSKECQKDDWNHHKIDCKIYKEKGDVIQQYLDTKFKDTTRLEFILDKAKSIYKESGFTSDCQFGVCSIYIEDNSFILMIMSPQDEKEAFQGENLDSYKGYFTITFFDVATRESKILSIKKVETNTGSNKNKDYSLTFNFKFE